MLIFRPIRESDLSGLVLLAGVTGGGLTTLPPNAAFLEERIHDSIRSFNPRVRRPGGEYYLFALEDSATGKIIGVSGIAARVGGFEPWYSYEIRREKFVHAPLKVDREMEVLHLKRQHSGPSEICSLFLAADHRRGGAGRLLSLARFLFIGSQRARFTEALIAELRGYIDETGQSPFWEAIGRHFFPFDFYAADVLSGLGEKQFIADLIPGHPLYVPLLPPAVQATLGRVHPNTEPARALLLSEGFALTNEIDIFDAGPELRAKVDDVRVIRQARILKVKIMADVAPQNTPLSLLANGALDFRATLAPVIEGIDGTVHLSAEYADALQLKSGDSLWLSPAR